MKQDCGHAEYNDSGHCGEMICWNYISKCPVHSVASVHHDRSEAECTQDTHVGRTVVT